MNAGPYTAPILLNSWINYNVNTQHQHAGYLLDRVGFVHLTGLIDGGAFPSIAFVLPQGMRPAKRLVFVVISNGAIGRCDVFANGQVWAFAGAGGYYSLDGVAFLATN